MELITPRLRLISASADMLRAALRDDSELGGMLSARVAAEWTEFGAPVFDYVLKQLEAHPEQQDWWTYFPVTRNHPTLIGSGGYKGPPDEDGFVEIGYEIAPTYRNHGFATEMARTLIDHAFSHPGVQGILAHTLAEKNASVAVLSHSGFQKSDELPDEEEGTIWKWQLLRP